MKFTLEIELGNEAMRTGRDVSGLLEGIARGLAADLVPDEPVKLYDANGNTVGSWQVTTDDRCYCGHWPEEHDAEGACAGCDASGQSPDGLCLHGGYEADPAGEGDLNG